MYCPHCGTPGDHSPCLVCGSAFAAPDPHSGVTTVLAGWWRRVGATIVDNFVLVVPSLLVYVGVADTAGVLTGAVAIMAIQGLYMVMLLSSPAGQTIGNRLAGTRVRDALSGATLTRSQAFRRWAPMAIYGALELTGNPTISALAALVALADYLYPLISPRKQTLHDRLAGTLVVRV